MHMIFFIIIIIQENKAENLFMLLYEKFLAFQINFHHHTFFNDLQIGIIFRIDLAPYQP